MRQLNVEPGSDIAWMQQVAARQCRQPRTRTITDDVTGQLEAIAGSDDFATQSEDLVDGWSDLGPDAVVPVLAFMEAHPDLDYGLPGPLVHFVERFYRQGYEERLAASVDRRPTMVTTWMLNRIINGLPVGAERGAYAAVLSRAEANPTTDPKTRERVAQFLDRIHALR